MRSLLSALGHLILLLATTTAAWRQSGETEPKQRRLEASTVPASSQSGHADNEADTTRAYWMRQANQALPGPCPFAAFGTVIVNHTAGGLGELVCTGANNNQGSGNPTLHGEMVAIDNCSAILTSPSGPYRLTPAEALNAFADLTLYTNAESCPMCASAIRWAGFREYVYGTSIDDLVAKGWGQIHVSSRHIFAQSLDLPHPTSLVGPFLTNETDVFFGWQFERDAACPRGCSRSADSSACVVASA